MLNIRLYYIQYIGCWPCGSRTTREGTMNLFLNLLTVSPLIRYAVRYNLKWIEADKNYVIYDVFKKDWRASGETDVCFILLINIF